MIKNYEMKARLVKACPHCGSKNIVTIIPREFKKNGLRANFIKCENCDAYVNGYTNVSGDYNGAYREALKKWNRRATA